MERRHFLKLALGFVAGGAALAASAQAAPLMPAPLVDDGKLPANPDAQPAVTSGDEVDRLTPEEVRWGRGRGGAVVAAGAAGAGAGGAEGGVGAAAGTGAGIAAAAATGAAVAVTGAAVITGKPVL